MTISTETATPQKPSTHKIFSSTAWTLSLLPSREHESERRRLPQQLPHLRALRVRALTPVTPVRSPSSYRRFSGERVRVAVQLRTRGMTFRGSARRWIFACCVTG